MNYGKHTKNIILVILGTLILAFGLYNFNDQHHLAEGGVLGILLLFKNIFDISLGFTNIVIDSILFIFAFKFFGKDFLRYSLLATVSFSTFYTILEKFEPIIPYLEDSILLASLLAGLFVGLGTGLVLLGGAAAGGDDAFALIIAKLTPLKVHHFYILFDGIILLLSLTYLSPSQLIWSFIATFTSSKVISIFHYYSLYQTVTITPFAKATSIPSSHVHVPIPLVIKKVS